MAKFNHAERGAEVETERGRRQEHGPGRTGNPDIWDALPPLPRPNPASVSFCTHCGQPTRPANAGCSSCLAELPKDAQFCPECGAPAGIPMGRFLPAEPEYMGFWIRAAARLIDATVIGAIVVSWEFLWTTLHETDHHPALMHRVPPVLCRPHRTQRPDPGENGPWNYGGLRTEISRQALQKAIVREIFGKFVSEIPMLCLGYLWIGLGRQETRMARPHSQHLRDPRSRPARAPRQEPLIAELNRSSRGSSRPPSAKPRNHPLTTATQNGSRKAAGTSLSAYQGR